MTIGEQLRASRRKRKLKGKVLSQKVLAQKLRVSQQQVSMYESSSYEGHSVSTLRRLGRKLGVKVQVLIDGVECGVRTGGGK